MEKIFFKKNKGFTIIETMIAISLFLIVIMAGMGALLNANLLHNKSQNTRSIMDNLSFIMEDMSRNLRTGYNFHCFVTGDVIPSTTSSIVSTPKSCANGWGISFEYSTGNPAINDDQWVYYMDVDSITGKGRISKSTQGPYASSAFIPLTPEEVNIDVVASGFSVLGAEPPTGDTQQPFVIIRLVGTITQNNIVTPFSLETAVSQRLIDS